ncbi:ribosome maturation factor RimP [Bdellovibrio sp. SKB1291214]|uniref:ribosome maturation factor RimP n=1 Tax=Bdellovibrio sp. SKB1291214 TaxID=1732569 RepID=UPI000B51CA93|nr:ribosome maturation factor RimP [Bdellovibrio sp. SKB1291214]UYL08485.1 ribosome maturation factor RimP [Bdellovibrio sp. SKB1291214]
MSERPSWLDQVEKIASDAAQSQGCLLYDIEFVGGGKGRTLRLFIDKDEEGGISLEDCSNVSKAFNEVLEKDEEIIPGAAYALEVSSPGLERHLAKPWHFQKAVGKKVYLKTSKALESMGVTDKKWKATKTVEEVIESADDQAVRFVVNDVEIKIPYGMIEKAKVLFEINKGQKK